MLFYNEVIDAFKFVFSDYKAYLKIGTILFLISLARKIVFNNLIDNQYVLGLLVVLSELLLYIQVGYGSYISLYTLKGRDYLPKLRGIKKLLFEGIKKSFAIYIYMLIIVIPSVLLPDFFSYDPFVDVFMRVVYVLVYCVMVLGLINRYLHHGSFIRAFNVKDMCTIFRNIKLKNYMLVLT